jgi:hypothetical protein
LIFLEMAVSTLLSFGSIAWAPPGPAQRAAASVQQGLAGLLRDAKADAIELTQANGQTLLDLLGDTTAALMASHREVVKWSVVHLVSISRWKLESIFTRAGAGASQAATGRGGSSAARQGGAEVFWLVQIPFLFWGYPWRLADRARRRAGLTHASCKQASARLRRCGSRYGPQTMRLIACGQQCVPAVLAVGCYRRCALVPKMKWICFLDCADNFSLSFLTFVPQSAAPTSSTPLQFRCGFNSFFCVAVLRFISAIHDS